MNQSPSSSIDEVVEIAADGSRRRERRRHADFGAIRHLARQHRHLHVVRQRQLALEHLPRRGFLGERDVADAQRRRRRQRDQQIEIRLGELAHAHARGQRDQPHRPFGIDERRGDDAAHARGDDRVRVGEPLIHRRVEHERGPLLAGHFVDDATRDDDTARLPRPLAARRGLERAVGLLEQDDAFFRVQHVEAALEDQIEELGQRDRRRQRAMNLVQRREARRAARRFRLPGGDDGRRHWRRGGAARHRLPAATASRSWPPARTARSSRRA